MARLPALCLALGAALLLAGCDKPATTAGDKAISLDDQLTQARQARQSGKGDDAVTLLRAAQMREPENPDILSQLGYALIDTEHPEEAIDAFDRLIALKPDSAAAWNGKGVAFDHAGNHLAAQELYKHALGLAPGAPSIRNNIAMSLILNGQVDQAIPLLEGLNASPASNPTIRQNLALAYGLKGDKAKALALNLKDLPPDQAKDNMRFYTEYARYSHKRKLSGLARRGHIGFAETPPEIALKEPPKEGEAPPRRKPFPITTDSLSDTLKLGEWETTFPKQNRP